MLVFIKKGYARKAMAAIVIGIYFTIFGFLLIITDLFFEDKDLFIVIGMGIGFAFIGYAFYAIYNVSKCNMKIEGVYLGSQPYSGSKGITKYAPVFEYTFEGQKYQQQTTQSFGARYIDNHFTPDEAHMIYLDEKNPYRILVRHRIQVFDIFMLLMGILFAATPFLV